MRILVIEDEIKMAKLLEKALKENGYFAELAFDGKMGEKLALRNEYTCIILDLILPEMNGYEVCKSLREKGIKTPIIMLTALNDTDDVVQGLDAGANDYMTKPFKLQELLARIRAHNRRSHHTETTYVHKVADLELNEATKVVTRGGKEITLTAKEYAMLELLMRNKGRVLSKSYIFEMIWGSDYDIESNILEVYISYLRNKLDKNHDLKLIHTMIGLGYVLKEK